MNFPLLVARRYLFAKKSHHAVGVISAVSVTGIAVGVIALVLVLSVFNGLEELARTLYGTFDPDLKVAAAEGKTFAADTATLRRLEADPDVYAFSQTVEENVLIRYDEQQEIGVLKGVDDQYYRVTGIDTMMLDGAFRLWENGNPQAAIGAVLAGKLHIGLHFITPVHLFAIRNTSSVSLNPEESVNEKYIFPSGVFAIDEEINAQYLLVPLRFARDLLENDSITGAVEIKVVPGANIDRVQARVAEMFGASFTVKNARQQKEFYFRMLQYEKWVGFMILAFVLLIASFNVVESLSMLMIEKKSDLSVLQGMGANTQQIGRIFIIQGWIIVLSGVLAGMFIGAILCMIQSATGFVSFSNTGTFVVDAYPVALHWQDFAMILLSVVCISIFTIYLPVKYFVKKWKISE
ncbi:MAG: ABC transporter permease [Bacteroidales bacterium]|jgi:lipoprotein-releasing system permease protein|nr:ABC transporter permease [Bacteroidales bacterium]